jgi:hypothetical protein
MAGPALHAHTFVACLNVSWEGNPGPNSSRTLERVSYVYRTETPNGFPFQTEFWLFVRLAHYRPREFTRMLYLTLIWQDDARLSLEVWTREFQNMTFRPAVTVRDMAARVDVTFEGPGRYEFQLWYVSMRKWDRHRARRILARTHMRIEG